MVHDALRDSFTKTAWPYSDTLNGHNIRNTTKRLSPGLTLLTVSGSKIENRRVVAKAQQQSGSQQRRRSYARRVQDESSPAFEALFVGAISPRRWSTETTSIRIL